MKRIGVVFLSVLILLTTVVASYGSTTTAAAEVSKEKVKPKQTIEVTVSISGNPGLAAWLFTLEWDSDTLELADQDNAVTAGAAFSAGTMLANPQGEGKLLVSWYTIRDNAQDGELFTAEFTVKDGAVNGTYPMTLTCSGENTLNAEETEIPIQTVGTSVTVTGGAERAAKPDSGTVQSEVKTADTAVSPTASGQVKEAEKSAASPPDTAEADQQEAEEDTLIVVQEETLNPKTGETETTSGNQRAAPHIFWYVVGAVVPVAAALTIYLFKQKNTIIGKRGRNNEKR